jgi:hypothetical protein
MKLRHRTSAESAAAFLEARKRSNKPPATPKQRRRPPAPRIARPAQVGPDTLFVLVRLPIDTYRDLIDHCDSFDLTPAGFIKSALAAAKLSRGGVG